MSSSRKLWIVAAGCFLLTSRASAANKLLIEPQTVTVGDTNVAIPIKLDNDQKLYGYSLSITIPATDATKLKITGLDLTGTVIDGAGWSFGQVLLNGLRLSWGVVLDITEPFDLNNVIPVGAKLHIANVKVDVTAAAAGTAQVQFKDFPANPPAPSAKNLLVGDQGVSVPFTTSDGTITIQAPQTGTPFHRGDADGNGSLQLTDAVRILNVLFLGVGAIPPPAPPGSGDCGVDPTPDAGGTDLGCAAYGNC